MHSRHSKQDRQVTPWPRRISSLLIQVDDLPRERALVGATPPKALKPIVGVVWSFAASVSGVGCVPPEDERGEALARAIKREGQVVLLSDPPPGSPCEAATTATNHRRTAPAPHGARKRLDPRPTLAPRYTPTGVAGRATAPSAPCIRDRGSLPTRHAGRAS